MIVQEPGPLKQARGLKEMNKNGQHLQTLLLSTCSCSFVLKGGTHTHTAAAALECVCFGTTL